MALLAMDLDAKVVGLLLIVAAIAIFAVFSSGAPRRPEVKNAPMRKLNVPCDPEWHAGYLKAFRRK
jgi:hypothetical protein